MRPNVQDPEDPIELGIVQHMRDEAGKNHIEHSLNEVIEGVRAKSNGSNHSGAAITLALGRLVERGIILERKAKYTRRTRYVLAELVAV